MPSPLVIYHGQKAVMPPQYFGSTGYYAVLAAYPEVYIDCGMRADKRFKTAHRCQIADTRGLLTLTMPVSHPHGPHSWAETAVSTHGHWPAVHLTALESAYGRTPFFEFYIDRLRPLFEAGQFEDPGRNVAEHDLRCDEALRRILGLDNNVSPATDAESLINDGARDFRRHDFTAIKISQYYQVRADRLGFYPGLSILDLIFNLGPEAPLYLLKAGL